METYGYMYDSAAGVFPSGTQLKALYYNGVYAHKPYQAERGQVWIDVLNAAPHQCAILDVEQDDATPQDVPGWLDLRNPIGRGIIYCNRATLPDVIGYAGSRPFDLWLATLDGTVPSVTVPHGKLLAVQAWTEGQYDKSAVVDKAFWAAHALLRSLCRPWHRSVRSELASPRAVASTICGSISMSLLAAISSWLPARSDAALPWSRRRRPPRRRAVARRASLMDI